MTRCYTTAFVLLCAAPLLAQPSLTSGSVTPVPGDVLHYLTGTYMQPGPGGAAQTWDYSASALTPATGGPVSYVSPAATGHAATFPEATVAQDEGGGNYLFYVGGADSYDDDGSYAGVAPNGLNLVCSDRLKLMVYPFSYGDSFIDSGTATGTQAGNSWPYTSNDTVTADGYGTLVTAIGTITNVLRVHSLTHIENDEYDPPIIYYKDSYLFYKSGIHGPVAALSLVTSTIFGATTTGSIFDVLDTTSLGIADVARRDIGVEVLGNPAHDRLELLFSTMSGHRYTLEVVDVNGAVLRREERTGDTPGIQREVIDLGGLPAGPYVLRVTDGKGGIGVCRFVRM
jgi:hypothetical protein